MNSSSYSSLGVKGGSVRDRIDGGGAGTSEVSPERAGLVKALGVTSRLVCVRLLKSFEIVRFLFR